MYIIGHFYYLGELKLVNAVVENHYLYHVASNAIDDNLTTIDLESPNAAITLVYVTTDEWRII